MASAARGGTFVYVGNTESNEIHVLDPSGRYLLAVGQLSHSLSSYAIDPAQRQAHKAEGLSHGPEPELDRDRRSAVTGTLAALPGRH